MEWENIASKAQRSVHETIPSAWKLPIGVKPTADNASVIDIPYTCGILTQSQLDITDQTATELLVKLSTGTLTSVEVTEAFCARAAIAHQLVCVPWEKFSWR